MTSSQKERILLVRTHMEFIQKSLQTLDAKLDELVAPYENAITLLCTIPGVDRSSAITILSEIGTNMSQFNSSKRLCCWAGLTPGNNESAGKKKSVRITRAGVYLKPALVQCAHAAVKSTTSSIISPIVFIDKSDYEIILNKSGNVKAGDKGIVSFRKK